MNLAIGLGSMCELPTSWPPTAPNLTYPRPRLGLGALAEHGARPW